MENRLIFTIPELFYFRSIGVTGIALIRYAYGQKIGNQNKFKVYGSKCFRRA